MRGCAVSGPVTRTIDRSRWPAGPWNDEPDRADWKDEATGLDCLALRAPTGHWCGYVAVPEGHPLFGRSYGDSYAEGADGHYGPTPGPHADDLRVHGGITYGDRCHGAICHVADEGAPPVWWLGFDCNHYGDQGPVGFRIGGVYRDLTYVREQCTALAAQLGALSTPLTTPESP